MRKKSDHRKIVELFINDKQINWPRDMALAKGLFAKYPDCPFWEALYNFFGRKFASMSQIQAREYMIEDRWVEWQAIKNLDLSYEIDTIELLDKSLVSVQIKPKRNLREFIDE